MIVLNRGNPWDSENLTSNLQYLGNIEVACKFSIDTKIGDLKWIAQ